MTLPDDEPDTVDHGPADNYHPIYDSVKEWLDGERQANPDAKIPARRRRPAVKREKAS